jgi:hypothetical protein
MRLVKSPTIYLKDFFLNNFSYLLKKNNNIKMLFVSAKVTICFAIHSAIHFGPRKIIPTNCCEQSSGVEFSIKFS